MKPISIRKAELEARMAQLKGRLAGIEAELDSHEAKDWEDLATEREGDEVLERLGQGGQAEIRMIEAALARIAAGDYGACAKCGPRSARRGWTACPTRRFAASARHEGADANRP